MPSDAENLRLRREARRKKILVSGEDRLSRIVNTFSGHPTQPSSTETEGAPTASDVHPADENVPTAAKETAVPSDDSVNVDTPVKPIDSRLRERLKATVVQSPSVSRTPDRSTPITQRDESETSPLLPFGDDMSLEGSPADIFGRSFPIDAFRERLLAEAGSKVTEQDETVEMPAPSAVSSGSRLLRIIRIVSVVLLALSSLYILVVESDELDELVGEDDSWDPEHTRPWKNWMRKLAVLGYKPIHETGELELGNMHVRLWMIFLTTELSWQIITFVYRQLNADKTPRGGLLELAAQLGFQNRRLEYLLQSVNDYRVIWESFIEDLFVFIFIVGSIIGVALLLS
ncbi:uncharacterized protein SPPG_03983 [Spizellomyces punctatus DAOM BR117]|uniref:Uncharacterized protein n=1 Tax=Spizellomyces punctatus (strain DAOM BR117) TaxID=645134 RepID=A0A0L0HIC5_SPIPD|nr:uncharacterized protein SPPG_03983 [Spizellomyces punctatus DAOM BR117]KND00882.1 hypothetical protein SPPG_03983 [Spizellomyces punctatus DAOM BR117]|eukprot:XP_016608921.1 hypothetical protein SPPG_03983 [Spizellomyces punctatus DAOM BR117]